MATSLLSACGTGEMVAGNVRAVAVRTTAPADTGDNGPIGRRVAMSGTAPGWTLVSQRTAAAGAPLPPGTIVVVRAYLRSEAPTDDAVDDGDRSDTRDAGEGPNSGAVVARIEVPESMSSTLAEMLAKYDGERVWVAGRPFSRVVGQIDSRLSGRSGGAGACTILGSIDSRTLLVASRATCEDLTSLVGALIAG